MIFPTHFLTPPPKNDENVKKSKNEEHFIISVFKVGQGKKILFLRFSHKEDLTILPSLDEKVQVGDSIVLTCKAEVPNEHLVTELTWFSPSGNLVPQDDR